MFKPMYTMDNTKYEVIIIGGSYAGLSAAMTLGRSLRKVLVIDSGQPCNRQTPHAHNFITHDGESPLGIRQKAKAEVLAYPSVHFRDGTVTLVSRTQEGFDLVTETGELFTSKKLLFATGVVDLFPDLKGFAECWGISVLHCPYCHGYEVHHQPIGGLANGEFAFEAIKILSNWSADVSLFTNGKATLSEEHTQILNDRGINIIEKEIDSIVHQSGKIEYLLFKDGSNYPLTALFAKPAFKQHCTIPESLGCELNEYGLLKVDDFQRTTIDGVYAAGDNCSLLRWLSLATAQGTKAGAFINKALIEESYASHMIVN